MAPAGPPAVVVVTSTAVDEPELDTLTGEYVETGRNHGKPVFKRQKTSDQEEEISLYYWDTRDGTDLQGWWFGQSVGASLVWSRCEESTAVPPVSGWRIPWDGAVNTHLQANPRVARTSAKEEVKEEEEPEQADSEQQSEQLLLARDQVALVEAEATEVLETATAMLEGEVPEDVARTVVESVQAQLESLLEVHQSLAADIVEARRSARAILPELTKLTPRIRSVQSSLAQVLTQAQGCAATAARIEVKSENPEEDGDAQALREGLSEANGSIRAAEEELQSVLSLDKAGTQTSSLDELAEQAERALKAARAVTARHVAAARKFAPRIRNSAAAEYAKLQKKLQRLEAELKPLRVPDPPPIDSAILAELSGRLESVETGIQEANTTLDSGDFAPDVLQKLESDLLDWLKSLASVKKAQDGLSKPAKDLGAKLPSELEPLRSRMLACKTGLDAVGLRLREVREDLRCHKMLETARARTAAAEEQLEIAVSSSTAFEEGMFEMSAAEAQRTGQQCRREADNCQGKVSQAARFAQARLGDIGHVPEKNRQSAEQELKDIQHRLDAVAKKLATVRQDVGQSEAWVLLQDVVTPVADVELQVQKALDASAPLVAASQDGQSEPQGLREAMQRMLDTEKAAALAAATARRLLAAKEREARERHQEVPAFATGLQELQARLQQAQQKLTEQRARALQGERLWQAQLVLEQVVERMPPVEAEVEQVELQCTPLGDECSPTQEQRSEAEAALSAVEQSLRDVEEAVSFARARTSAAAANAEAEQALLQVEVRIQNCRGRLFDLRCNSPLVSNEEEPPSAKRRRL